tara:strand:- start:22 stop:417 length:396 start_codon:yes stop_codon:yes gene_type:complete
MSYLLRNRSKDVNPINIPEPMSLPKFQEKYKRRGSRRSGSKNRMAGQADGLRRSIEKALQSGGGEGFLPEPQTTTTIPREKTRPSKPTRMTKEEFDKMPRRRTRLAPGMEDLIDRFDEPSELAKTLGGKYL